MNNSQKLGIFTLAISITGCPSPTKKSEDSPIEANKGSSVIKLDDQDKIDKFILDSVEEMFFFFKDHPNKLSEREIDGLIEKIKSYKNEYNNLIKFMLKQDPNSVIAIDKIASSWNPNSIFPIILGKINISYISLMQDVAKNRSSSKYKGVYDASVKSLCFNVLAYYYNVLNYPGIKKYPANRDEIKNMMKNSLKIQTEILKKFNIDESLVSGKDSLYEKLFSN